MQRHEVPTHLNVEDKAFAGLTMRQLMVAVIGPGHRHAAHLALQFRDNGNHG
jgi:hypothetical protein